MRVFAAGGGGYQSHRLFRQRTARYRPVEGVLQGTGNTIGIFGGANNYTVGFNQLLTEFGNCKGRVIIIEPGVKMRYVCQSIVNVVFTAGGYEAAQKPQDRVIGAWSQAPRNSEYFF